MPPKPPKPPLTHFLCLPLINQSSRQQFQTALASFASQVAAKKDSDEPVIPDKAIRPVGTLHLTIGVMSLRTQERLDGALELLQGLDVGQMLRDAADSKAGPDDARDAEWNEPKDVEPKVKVETENLSEESKAGVSEQAKVARSTLETPLRVANGAPPQASPDDHLPALMVSLTGITSMHQPTKTSILYANPIDTTGRLQPFCNALRDLFQSKGFLLPDDRPLLLHATVANAIYASDRKSRSRGGGHGKGRGKLTFDATELLEGMEDFKWAEDITVEKVAICKMGAEKIKDDGGDVVAEEYTEVGSKALPSTRDGP